MKPPLHSERTSLARPPRRISPGAGLRLAVGCGLLLAGCLGPLDEPPAEAAPAVHFERSMLDGFGAEIADAREFYGVPGAVVAVVYGDHPVFTESVGRRAAGLAAGDRPPSENTLFRIGTLSRALSSSLIATLVDERRLDWRGRLPNGLSPELARQLSALEASAQGELAQGAPAPVAMPGGVPRPPESLGVLLSRASLRPPSDQAAEPDAYGELVLRALDAAGVGEGSSGFRRALQDRLVGPSGMVRTAVADQLPSLVEDYATPHARAAGGGIAAIDYVPSGSAPSTGVASTAADLGRFLSVHLEGGVSQRGKRVVSPNNLAVTRDAVFRVDAPRGAMPLADDCCGFGLGWTVAELGEDQRWIGAEGGIAGYAALVGLLPERNLGLVVLTNLDHGQGGGSFTREVRDAFLARLLGRAGTVSHRLDHGAYLKSSGS